MTQLNHQGPENNGPKSGRKLGQCKSKTELPQGEPGKGMGLKRRSGGGSGKGKRLKSTHLFNSNLFNDDTKNSRPHQGQQD